MPYERQRALRDELNLRYQSCTSAGVGIQLHGRVTLEAKRADVRELIARKQSESLEDARRALTGGPDAIAEFLRSTATPRYVNPGGFTKARERSPASVKLLPS
jgi:hypothetical protein